MSILQNFTNSSYKFYPAYLSIGKEWVIVYHVFNPYTNEMQRYRMRLNHIKSVTERRKIARTLITEINNKLFNGWNPCIKEENKVMFITMFDLIALYKKSKFAELEDNSKRSYESFLQKLSLYVEKINKEMYAHNFSAIHASNIMLSIKEKVSHRTYNNYLQFFKILFNWFVEHNYMQVNPFAKLQPVSKKLCKKKRISFTRKEIHDLVEFLNKKHPRFSVVCQLIYYCLLRPDDIVELRKSSFDLERNLIYIRAEETKNQKDSYRVIPSVMDETLKSLGIEDMKDTDYLFGDTKNYSLLPSSKQLCPRKLSRIWSDFVRPKMNWGMEYQLYGLKDTGITNMLADGISPAFVQGQADHYSLEVTNKYVHTRTPEGYEQIRNMMKKI